jgi:fido (protein-threonine AMPylation protein)
LSDLFVEPDDATPLSREEREGLIPTHIALRRELNELEQANIVEANIWAFQRTRDPVDERFGRDLHKRMFGQVWRWVTARCGRPTKPVRPISWRCRPPTNTTSSR